MALRILQVYNYSLSSCYVLCTSLDAIMDMLNSDKYRQAIMKQQSNHSRQTEKVKQAIKVFKKSDDYCDGPKNKE